MDGIGIASLFVVERSGQEQLGHAEHTVHRGSDLVTHVGQELRLGLAGRFSGVLGLAKGFFLLLAFGNVLNERGELLRASDGQATGGNFDRKCLAGTGPTDALDTAIENRGGHESRNRWAGIRHGRRMTGDQVGRQGLSDRLGAWNVKHDFRLGIPVGNDSGGSRGHYGVEGGFDDQLCASRLTLQGFTAGQFVDSPKIDQGRALSQNEAAMNQCPGPRVRLSFGMDVHDIRQEGT